MKHHYTLMYSLLAVTLVGCGGGGGGGGGFDPNGARVTAERTQIALEGKSTEYTFPPNQIIKFSVNRAPPEGYTVGLIHTENGLFFVDFVATGELTAELIVKYPPSFGMTPGVYEDTIEVLVCLDDFCEQQIAGSPITVTSSYVIIDGNIDPRFGQKNIDAPARELVWNPEEMVMYATIPTNDGIVSRALAVIDPQIGEIVRTVPLQHDPDQLAISNDNDYLYVGYRNLNEVHRFTLPDLIQDLAISLGVPDSPNNRRYTAGDMSVHPLDSTIVAVARQIFELSPRATDIVIFDGAVARPLNNSDLDQNATFDVRPSMVAWNDDGSEIYSKNRDGSGFNFYAYSVSSEGLTLVANTRQAFSRFSTLGQLIYDGGELIDPNGDLVDAATGKRVGQYRFDGDHLNSHNTALSAAGDMVFALHRADSSSNLTMSSYLRSSREPIQSIFIRNSMSQPFGSMITWGTNGVAYSSEGSFGGGAGGIAILEGSFFTTPELMEPTSRSHVSWKPALHQE